MFKKPIPFMNSHRAPYFRVAPVTALVIAAALTVTGCTASVEPEPTEPKNGPVAGSGLLGVDAERLQKALTDGSVTSVQLVDAYLARIDAYDSPYKQQPGLAAIIRLNDHAREDAQRLDEERAAGQTRGPLHGIPVLVKEAINVEGMPLTINSLTYGDALSEIVPPRDAFAVDRLREAGAIILAHSRNAEGGVNPYDQTRHPGGSSSGNSAGIASALAPLGLGEDTGGSVRMPAAWTSTVGFRPSTGLVSMDGVAPYGYWADTLGPQALTVTDAANRLDAIAGYDPTNTPSRHVELPSTFTEHLDSDFLRGKRIGIYEPARRGSDQEVIEAFDETVQRFTDAGAEVVSLDVSLVAIPSVAEANGTTMEPGRIPHMPSWCIACHNRIERSKVVSLKSWSELRP